MPSGNRAVQRAMVKLMGLKSTTLVERRSPQKWLSTLARMELERREEEAIVELVGWSGVSDGELLRIEGHLTQPYIPSTRHNIMLFADGALDGGREG